MDRPCRSLWTGAHENFQAEEYDAGASLTHQASQHESRGQLDSASPHFEMFWKLLCRSLMKAFIKRRTCIVKGTLSLKLSSLVDRKAFNRFNAGR
jgi:hypothetical protein